MANDKAPPGGSDSTMRNLGAVQDDEPSTLPPTKAPVIRPPGRMPTTARPSLADVGPKESGSRPRTAARPALSPTGAPVKPKTTSRPALQPEPAAASQETVIGPISLPNAATSEAEPTAIKSPGASLPDASASEAEPTALGRGGDPASRGPSAEAMEAAGSTVMIRPEDIAAAKKGTAAADDGSTVNLPNPRGGEEGAKSAGRGFEAVILGGMLLIGVAAAAKVFSGPGKPSTTQLLLLYPYGAAGGVMPDGSAAPAAAQVVFAYQGKADCGEGNDCVKYIAAKPGQMEAVSMTLQYSDDTGWKLISSAPAQPPKG